MGQFFAIVTIRPLAGTLQGMTLEQRTGYARRESAAAHVAAMPAGARRERCASGAAFEVVASRVEAA